MKNENLNEEDLIFGTDQILQDEPNFPLQENNELTILNIGTIVAEKSFHTGKYIYPLGYRAKRLEALVKKPKEMVWYLLEIKEDIHHNPVFRVEMENDESVFFEGSEPTKTCLKLNKSLGKKILLSGPEFFELSFSVVHRIIQNLDVPKESCLKFQIGGACNPNEHYMVKLDDRMEYIKEMYIKRKEYFCYEPKQTNRKDYNSFRISRIFKIRIFHFLN